MSNRTLILMTPSQLFSSLIGRYHFLIKIRFPFLLYFDSIVYYSLPNITNTAKIFNKSLIETNKNI